MSKQFNCILVSHYTMPQFTLSVITTISQGCSEDCKLILVRAFRCSSIIRTQELLVCFLKENLIFDYVGKRKGRIKYDF